MIILAIVDQSYAASYICMAQISFFIAEILLFNLLSKTSLLVLVIMQVLLVACCFLGFNIKSLMLRDTEEINDSEKII